MFKGSTILITGGTGTLGQALTKRLLKLNSKRIIIFSRDELKQELMRNELNDKRLHFIIGDIRDREAINEAMKGVDFVIHTAALKQVPAYEINPMEAYKTNVIGSHNVFTSAINNNVKKVVAISTDKAVYPINAYGMSKAMMEKLMLSYKSKTIFCGVRYGNVLYSRGSVVPYFVSLIKQDKPLVITDLAMTRFLLTLDEAVDLVLEALKNGKRGKTYIKRSPACTIDILAQALCQIFDSLYTFKVIGKKQGEKLHETLEEGFTSENTRQLNVEETKKLLLTLPQIQLALK